MRQGLIACLTFLMLAACSSGGRVIPEDQIYAPALDPEGEAVDGLIVGHRLMEAGQYELALEAFTRAAATHGLTGEVLTSLGTANLGLGRLNQSETLLETTPEPLGTQPQTRQTFAFRPSTSRIKFTEKLAPV